jgi:hypothetical protein
VLPKLTVEAIAQRLPGARLKKKAVILLTFYVFKRLI